MAPGDYLFKKSCPPDAKGFGESGFPWAGAQGLLLESADFSTRSDRNNPLRPRFAGAPPPRGEFCPSHVSWFWGERPSRGWRGSPGEAAYKASLQSGVAAAAFNVGRKPGGQERSSLPVGPKPSPVTDAICVRLDLDRTLGRSPSNPRNIMSLLEVERGLNQCLSGHYAQAGSTNQAGVLSESALAGLAS